MGERRYNLSFVTVVSCRLWPLYSLEAVWAQEPVWMVLRTNIFLAPTEI